MGLLDVKWWMLDAKIVVDAFNCGLFSNFEFGCILQNLQIFFFYFFNNSYVEFSKRGAIIR